MENDELSKKTKKAIRDAETKHEIAIRDGERQRQEGNKIINIIKAASKKVKQEDKFREEMMKGVKESIERTIKERASSEPNKAPNQPSTGERLDE